MALTAFDVPRLLSTPMVIHWAGFEADTFTLQRQGWDLSASQNITHCSIQIAGRHSSTGGQFITNVADFDFVEHARFFERGFPPKLSVGLSTSEIYVTSALFAAFAPIDATPQYTDLQPQKLSDLVHFAPRIPDLIVPEESVGDLLERVRKMQVEPLKQQRLQLRERIGIL